MTQDQNKSLEEIVVEWQETRSETLGKQIVDACEPIIEFRIARYFGTPELYEELRGEAYTAIVEAANRFTPIQNTRFSTYVRSWVAASLKPVLMRYTDQPQFVDVDVEQLSSAYTPTPEDICYQHEIEQHIDVILKGFSTTASKIFTLRYKQGLTFKEIARKLDKHPEYVRHTYREITTKLIAKGL